MVKLILTKVTLANEFCKIVAWAGAIMIFGLMMDRIFYFLGITPF